MDSFYTSILIGMVCFDLGILAGVFLNKFTSKKECDKSRADLWAQVDAIRNCMTGGKVRFELRMIHDNENGGTL